MNFEDARIWMENVCACLGDRQS